MRFQIAASNGQEMSIEAEHWLAALGNAMVVLGAELAPTGRWTVSPGPGAGAVIVDMPMSAIRWLVKPAISVVGVVAKGPELPADDEFSSESVKRSVTEELPMDDPPPVLQMPTRSTFAPTEAQIKRAQRLSQMSGDAFAERIWDLTTDLPMLGGDAACQRTLDLVAELVPCQAASVIRGRSHDFTMRVSAASGPVGDKVIGRTMPFGEGFVGMCWETMVPLHIHDVTADPRHDKTVDADTGFVTREILCVPIAADGQAMGVIQIINPGDPIVQEEVEAISQISKVLANAIGQGES